MLRFGQGIGIGTWFGGMTGGPPGAATGFVLGLIFDVALIGGVALLSAMEIREESAREKDEQTKPAK